jgi:hypothetical protein
LVPSSSLAWRLNVSERVIPDARRNWGKPRILNQDRLNEL